MTAQLALFAAPTRPPCVFYTGTHMPNWLGTWSVRLFVSRRRLMNRRTFPRALAPWALDSGGFTEVAKFGGWTMSARDYASEVRTFRDEIGRMEWAACQDWMCEPFVLAKTGKTIREHQRLTVQNYLDLVSVAPDIAWTPVVQGWERDDYLRHVEDYAAAGVDLRALPIVGVGSVCRRQHSADAAAIFASLSRLGIRCHGFGLKLGGLERSAHLLASADSLAWSFAARKRPPLPGHRHKTCANCQPWAAMWRERVLSIEGVA